MSDTVFANGNAISCKAGDGKVIAAMPDVCLSPPSPPAGPVPIPYPNTSFSKDMQNGSKTVMIGGKEVMLKDQSFYKTSPLGDEAATNSFGGSVITHVITGKTYFNAWSMDVKFEDANVDRHLDLTTSNHASYPGSTGPMTNAQKLALARIAKGKCPCCNKAMHAQGPGKKNSAGVLTPVPQKDWWKSDSHMNRDEWYKNHIDRNPKTFPDPAAAKAKYDDLIKRCTKNKPRRDANGKKCTCKGKRVLPKPPCDVFWDNPDKGQRKDRSDHIKDSWNGERNNYQTRHGIPDVTTVTTTLQTRAVNPIPSPTVKQIDDERSVNHLTPKTAGGCPTGDKNLQPNGELCDVCRSIDDEFGDFQKQDN